MEMIKEKINELKSDTSELSSFLFNLFEGGYNIKGDPFLVSELEQYLLKEDDWLLKKVAIGGLLVEAELNDEKYINATIKMLNDVKEDSEVRSWAIDGLLSVSDKSNKDLIGTLKRIGYDDNEKPFLRYKALQGLLELNGVTLFDLNLRDGFIPSYDKDFTIDGFIEFIKKDLEENDLG